MTLFCPSCGTQLENDARFCTHCGKEITAAENSVPAAVTESVHTIPNEPQSAPKERLEKPLGAWTFVGLEIAFSIPIIGLVTAIVLSCLGSINRNIRSYARSKLLILLLVAIVVLILSILIAGTIRDIRDILYLLEDLF